jgi:hypothetical protein
MDNIKNLTYDELLEVYKTIEDYLKFLTGELQSVSEQGEEA